MRLISMLALLATSAAESMQWDCIFLHGGGVKESGPPTPTFPEYWGHLEDHTPQCRSRMFIHANTTGRAFDDTSPL